MRFVCELLLFCQCLEASKVTVQNDARLSALSNTSVD